MKMKKLITLLLALAMVLSLAARMVFGSYCDGWESYEENGVGCLQSEYGCPQGLAFSAPVFCRTLHNPPSAIRFLSASVSGSWKIGKRLTQPERSLY